MLTGNDGRKNKFMAYAKNKLIAYSFPPEKSGKQLKYSLEFRLTLKCLACVLYCMLVGHSGKSLGSIKKNLLFYLLFTTKVGKVHNIMLCIS
jgi:hypothetical protein